MKGSHFEQLLSNLIERGSQDSLARYNLTDYIASGYIGGPLVGPCGDCERKPVFKVFAKTIEAECPYCGATLAIRRIGKYSRWVMRPESFVESLELAEAA